MHNKRFKSSKNEIKQSISINSRKSYRSAKVLAENGISLGEDLGEGSFSKVKHGICETRGDVAVKIISHNKLSDHYINKFLTRELAVWRKVTHPHIIKMYESFRDARNLYIVSEYAPNGDALVYMQINGPLEEKHARIWMYQIINAVAYLHNRGIAHRDLKLENLVLDDDNNLKVCDFGFAQEKCIGRYTRTFCGTIFYVAPEILSQKAYDPRKADIWSIGVIMFALLTASLPFDAFDGSSEHLLAEHEKLDLDWNPSRNFDIDEDCKPTRENDVRQVCRDVITYALSFNFQERPSIRQLARSAWFTQLKCENKIPSKLSKTEPHKKRSLDVYR